MESTHVQCPYCLILCPNKKSLRNHTYKYHRSQDICFFCQTANRYRYICPFCLEAKDVEANMVPIFDEFGKAWQCAQCGYSTRRKSDLKDHIDAKHIERDPLPCNQCDMICPNKKSLKNHMYKHHKKPHLAGKLHTLIGAQIPQKLHDFSSVNFICTLYFQNRKLRHGHTHFFLIFISIFRHREPNGSDIRWGTEGVAVHGVQLRHQEQDPHGRAH